MDIKLRKTQITMSYIGVVLIIDGFTLILTNSTIKNTLTKLQLTNC